MVATNNTVARRSARTTKLPIDWAPPVISLPRPTRPRPLRDAQSLAVNQPIAFDMTAELALWSPS